MRRGLEVNHPECDDDKRDRPFHHLASIFSLMCLATASPALCFPRIELPLLTEAERRDFSTLTISYKAPIYDAGQGVDGGAERRPFSGSQQAIADDIGTFAGLGVSELIFDFRSESLAESLERMERFAPLIRRG